MTEIAAKADFGLIRYAQVWEDADILVEALAPRPGETVVSVASAGDNALALLATGARVVAVDLSPAQLACVRLRMEAYRALSHPELLELIGSRPSARRPELLDRVARGLSTDDQSFWAARRAEVAAHGAGGVGKFERYFRLFRTRVLPLVHRRERVAALLTPRALVDRAVFFDRVWNSWRWRAMFGLFFSRAVMGRLGRDPAFFDQVEGGPATHLRAKVRHALVEQDPSANPYLHWILTGRHGAALPRALRPEQFDAIRDNLACLELRLGPIEQLAAEGLRADAFNLSDIFEYMSPGAHEAAYLSVLDMAAPGGRLAYWNMMAPRRAPATLAHRVQRRTEVEQSLKARDKAFFYSDFVVEDVR